MKEGWHERRVTELRAGSVDLAKFEGQIGGRAKMEIGRGGRGVMAGIQAEVKMG